MSFSKEGSEEALSLHPKQRRPTTWRITEFSKYLGSPPFKNHFHGHLEREQPTPPTPLTIVIHHLTTWDDGSVCFSNRMPSTPKAMSVDEMMSIANQTLPTVRETRGGAPDATDLCRGFLSGWDFRVIGSVVVIPPRYTNH